MRPFRVVLLLALGPAPAAAAFEGTHRLDPGESRFWLGGRIEQAAVERADQCGSAGPCPEWRLLVGASGTRLRVAIDTPSREDDFALDVLRGGDLVTSVSGADRFNAEAHLAVPAAGTYVVRVRPVSVSDAPFRMRARLEQAPARPVGNPSPPRPLLPNLRAVPPLEFGFVAPANPFNGLYPPDDANPPLSAGGFAPLSCTADESAPVALGGQGAVRCLRLTSGPINVGAGPFIKRFTFQDDLASGQAEPHTLRGPVEQVVLMSDGTTVRRAAGHYSFHTTHGHFHDEGILTYELFRVAGEELVPAGSGTKSGFCPADQLLGEWRGFDQDPAGTFGPGDSTGGSCFSTQDGTFALTRGWGDVYRWQRPGQFVEFSGQRDGDYVVRATVDRANVTLETDETDNTAYAHIRVRGSGVEILERGQGTSHLDQAREVFTGLGPASRDAVGGDLPVGVLGVAPVRGSLTARDVRAPRLGGLRLVRYGDGRLRLRVLVSESATLTVTVRRGRRTLGVVRRSARRGAVTVVLPAGIRRVRGLRIGVVARDRAGNFSRPGRLSR